MVRPVAVVIPAFNEAATIAGVVAQVAALADVIVVDDRSSDGTAAAARAAGAVVVSHERNRGYSGSIDTGLRQAAQRGHRAAITMDADGQHHPAALPAMIAALDAGCDLVCGIRRRPARLAELFCCLFAQAAIGIRDPLCGMKGYRLSLWRAAGGVFDPIDSIGAYLLLWAARHRALVATVPVTIRPRADLPRFGAGSWRADRRIFAALLRMLRYWLGRPLRRRNHV